MLSVLLECQAPYSDWILDGKKSIETRRYPFPPHLLNKSIWLFETPSGKIGISALPDIVDLSIHPEVRIMGSIVVSESFQYVSQHDWDQDAEKHCVDPSSGYGWSEEGEYYGWVISSTSRLPSPAISHIKRSYRSFFLPVIPVPTVDISNPNSDDVLRSIEEQCKSIGFLRVSWKSFPTEVVSRAHDAMRRFFELDDDVKESVSKSTLTKTNDSYCPTGFRGTKGMYNGEGRESWSCIRPDYIPGDRAFDNLFYQNGRDFFAEAPDPQVLWPSESDVPGFREAITEYYAAVESLGHNLFRIFARILRLTNPDALVELSRHHASSLNVSHLKPSQDRQGSTVVLQPHADITCFTILSHDTSEGASGPSCLEILNPAYDPNDPHSIAWLGLADTTETPSFLVNLGQIMERWSNGQLKATLHRVVKPIHESTLFKRRQAMVFFQVANYDSILEPMINLDDKESCKRFPPERMSDFTATRFGPLAKGAESALAYSIYNKDIIDPKTFIKLATEYA